MAVSAYQTFGLDQVWLIPAGHSPNKDEEKMTSGEYRYEMCQIATKTDNKLYVSRMELDCQYFQNRVRRHRGTHSEEGEGHNGVSHTD